MSSATGTITAPKIKTYSQAGPASYATGGFVITGLTSDFNWIGHIEVAVTTRGVLPAVDYEIFKNVNASAVESIGNGGIKIMRGRYDRSVLNAVSGQPGGVTVRSVKFAAAETTGSSHNHSINHDHPAATSATETASGTTGVLLASGGGNMRNHTHSFDVAAFTGNSTSTTHTHDRSFEYAHSHSINASTTTDVSLVEMAAATDLSGVTFKFTVYGFGKA